MKNVLLGLLLALATSNAIAQETEANTKTGFYAGIGSTGTAWEIDGFDEASVGSFSGKVGFAINKNLAIEGRIIGESDYDSIGSGVEVRLDRGQAIYMRLSLGNPTFDPYVLLGYAKLEATLRDSYYYGLSLSAEESGGAFGFGANWNVSELISITGDWTIPAEDTVQFNLGLDFKF